MVQRKTAGRAVAFEQALATALTVNALPGEIDGFTRRYGLKQLVWYETHDDIRAAIAKEKLIKSWPRAWKIRTIESANPRWADLVPSLSA